MGKETGISWTQHTFNPWWGCTKVSSGCDHCYAETFDRRVGGAHWGKGVERRIFGEKHWAEPLGWDAAAKKNGVKETVFCASMADWLDDEAPQGQRDRLMDLIWKTPNLIWQLLTKRPQRIAKYMPLFDCPPNIWLGCSTEDQPNYNLRWPILARGAESRELTTFISYEPALGPLKLWGKPKLPDWVICGGESGAGRREMQQEWAESVQEQCDALHIKFFMKQMSAATPTRGSEIIPAHLLIRQLP